MIELKQLSECPDRSCEGRSGPTAISSRVATSTLRRSAGLAGTVTTSFMIDLGGHIGELSVKAPDRALGTCMTDVMKKWTFAPPVSRMQILYPITFKTT